MADPFLLALEAAMTGQSGIAQALREHEVEIGNEILFVGGGLLPPDDWDPNTVVSRDGNVIRLILLVATKPGNGALTRLLATCERAGYTPSILAPTVELQAALQRRGWRFRLQNNRAGWPEKAWFPPHVAANALAIAGTATMLLMAATDRAHASASVACSDPYAATALGAFLASLGVTVLLAFGALLGRSLAGASLPVEESDSVGPSWHAGTDEDNARRGGL